MFLNLKTTILTKFLKFYPKERKQVFLLGDFDINLLNYNDHQPTNDFLDLLASNSFIPYILHPTRITIHLKTHKIDNTFPNYMSHEITSGNITTTVSDNLPHCAFVPNILSKNCLTFMKEIGQNLNTKSLYLPILLKIELTYFKLINKMLIILRILSKIKWTPSGIHMLN